MTALFKYSDSLAWCLTIVHSKTYLELDPYTTAILKELREAVRLKFSILTLHVNTSTCTYTGALSQKDYLKFICIVV